MTEMKNICGKIPKDLHEKVREEIELTESSTQKFIQQVIEEHFERLAGKGEMSMGTARTIAVQVSEELFQRLKTVIAKKGMKQKDFLKYKYGSRSFWCRRYYVDTVGRNKKVIAEYIRNQLEEDYAADQISIKEFTDPFTGDKRK